MKQKIKNYWKKNGFYTVLTTVLVVVLSISGIAGYRSAMADRKTAQNAAEFNQAEVDMETPGDNNTGEVPAAANTMEESENVEGAEAVSGEIPETFGENAEFVWPVEGEVMKEFSMDTTIYFETLDQYRCNPALLIKADVNQEVVAAFGGTVESIKDDSISGTTVTVDLGNGYKMVYGQMKDVKVEEGAKIVKGQSLGSVAQPTRYFSEEGSHLCLILMKDEAPIDPMTFMPEKAE